MKLKKKSETNRIHLSIFFTHRGVENGFSITFSLQSLFFVWHHYELGNWVNIWRMQKLCYIQTYLLVTKRNCWLKQKYTQIYRRIAEIYKTNTFRLQVNVNELNALGSIYICIKSKPPITWMPPKSRLAFYRRRLC